MAVRVAKIDAAAAVPVIEFTVVEAPGRAAIGELRLPDAAQDRIELGIADMEGVMVALELLVVIKKERECVVDTYWRKMPVFRIGVSGAKVHLAGDGTKGTWAERVIRLLNGSEAPSVTTSELGDVLRREWRKISRDVLTPEFLVALDGMGWRYVSGKGRYGSWFELPCGNTGTCPREHGMHTSVPPQKLQTLTVMMVLVSQTPCKTTVVHYQSIYGRWLKVTFAGPR